MVSYEREQRILAELGRASYRNYIGTCWELVCSSFSEWYGCFKLVEVRINKLPPEDRETTIINDPELYSNYEDLVVYVTNLWLLIKSHVGYDPLDREKQKKARNKETISTPELKKYKSFTEKVLDLPDLYTNKEEIIDVIFTLGRCVSPFLPLSDRREVKSI